MQDGVVDPLDGEDEEEEDEYLDDEDDDQSEDENGLVDAGGCCGDRGSR